MVYCSRKCQIFSTTICALIWAAVFIVAMLVPYIILRAQNEGVKKLIVIDRDTWTQKQWDNYTVSTLNMSYYLWNATNLDAVMKDQTGATLIKWQEVGPFNISKISHMEVLSGESGSSPSPYIRYRKLTTYKISDESSRKLLSRPIVAVNPLWVGALSKAATSLYAASVSAGQGTPEQKLAAIRANLYPQALNRESLFYGPLTQAWLSGAAAQFTSLNVSGYTPESALIPAFRILSVGKYLEAAVDAIGKDPTILSINPSLNITANKELASGLLAGLWGAGQADRTSTIAQRSTNPEVKIFQDFELPAAINRTSIGKIWDTKDTGVTAVALVTVPGLRNWGVALQCVALGSPTRCSAQQAAAYQLVTSAYGVDFPVIVSWLAHPVSGLLDSANVIKPDWRRNYTEIAPNLWAYIAKTPAERFQQIIVKGFEKNLPTLAGAAPLYGLSSSGFDPTAYSFAPASIRDNDGAVVLQLLAKAPTQIQSFYDLALLQYATGWVVSLALPNTPIADMLRGITVSKPEALGAAAGFGGQLNIENEPIEFSAAVQLVDPTIPVKDSRLTVPQAARLLAFIQGRIPNATATTAQTVITPAIIAFTLVSEGAIRVSQATLDGVYKQAAAANNGNLTALLAPYRQLRTSAVFEGIEKLSSTFPTNPNFTLPFIWAVAKAAVTTELTKAGASALLDALPLFLGAAGINQVTFSNLRPFVAYFHSYFRRLQGGVGPIESMYTIPGAESTAASVLNEGYNPVFGVSRRTNGLFIQRTAFEFFFGGRSHLPNTELQPILSPVTSYLDENYREYDGGAIKEGAIPTPGANPIMLSAVYNVPYEKNTLEEAKRRNAIVYQGQDTAINTGRMDINAVGQYHSYNGVTRYNSICQYNNPGKTDAARADETSRLPGEVLRSACVEGSPSDYKVFDNDFYEEVSDRVNDPGQFQPFREGDSNILPVLGSFISELARNVMFNYSGVVSIKGINLRRYLLDSKYLNVNDAPNNPYKNANYRQIAKPGFYPDVPDGLASGLYLFGAPIYISKPHFLQASSQVTSAFAPGSFNPETPIHETYIDVDALSGKTLHARKRLQANIYVPKEAIDASPHLEPIFKSGDKYFPYYWAQEAGTISDDDAETFKTNIYKARDIGRIIQIVVGVISSILFVICVALVVRSCTKTPDATTTDK